MRSGELSVSDAPVLYAVAEPLAWLRLNRPEKLNALNGATVEALGRSLEQAAADDRVKVLILGGMGRAFSAGYDLAEEAALSLETAEQWRGRIARNVGLTMALWSFPKPT